MFKLKKIIVLFLILLSSCGYTVKNSKTKQDIPIKNTTKVKNYKHIYCIKDIKLENKMETALDIITRYTSQAILTSGNKIECSSKTDRFLTLDIKSLYIYSIGYSISQRASIYKVNINMDLIVEDRKNRPIFKKNIQETTQYVGSGLRADIERRYALEELAKLVEIRIYSILTGSK